MITRCPSCDTHFRVRTDQLAARAGQVRCGKCSQVFNSLDHLIEETLPAVGPAQHMAFEAGFEPAHRFAEEPAAEPAVASEREPAGPEPLPDPAMQVLAAAEPSALPAAAFDFGPAAAADTAGRARRWPLALGALLLFPLLLAQVAYHYRTAISLLFPETKPWFAQLCETLDCNLPLPRRIELMSIEASDLQADTTNPSVMVLSATIRNRAIFDQQLPLLELTLTDAQDQPVVRRVLAAQEYLDKAANARAAFAASTEVAVKVFVEGSQVKATGYRLYLFYP